MGSFAVRQQLHTLFKLGSGKVLLVPAFLEGFLQIAKACRRRRISGELDLISSVVRREVRVGLGHVVIVAEYEQLGSPGSAVGGYNRSNTGSLDFVVVGFELSPGFRNAKSKLGIDLLIVQNAAAKRCANRHSENL